MKRFAGILFVLLCIGAVRSDEVDNAELMNTYITITNQDGKVLGSGTLFVSGKKAYVLTCGHLFTDMRTTETMSLDNEDGTVKEEKRIVWERPKILQTIFNADGEEVGGRTAICKVLLYSPPEEGGGNDLALLEVTMDGYALKGASFTQKMAKTIKPGTAVTHIGALFGLPGCVVAGNISRLDVKYKNRSFNIAIVNGRPGSSGGPVFAKEDGKFVYVGMTVRGDSAGIMMLKRPQMIRDWLVKNKMGHVIGLNSCGKDKCNCGKDCKCEKCDKVTEVKSKGKK